MVDAVKARPKNPGLGPEESFGAWLRRQREVREIGLREIAESSKISLRYLEAMEQDRFEILPAPVFAKGFLREYARYVGLDPDDVVNHYLAAQTLDDDSKEPEQVRPRSLGNGSYVLYLASAAAVVFIVVGALAALLRKDSGRAEIRPPMAAPALVAAPSAPKQVTAGGDDAPMPLRVTLDFTQSCWVDAFVDGERQVSELRIQGESLRLEAERDVSLILGNVAGAGIEVNGVPFTTGAQNGETIEIDLELAKRMQGASA